MKDKLKLIRTTEYDLEGNIKSEKFKIGVDVVTQADHGIHERYMNKTFDTYAEARKYIRTHEGIWK